MHLQVKKLKVDIFAHTSGKNLPQIHIITHPSSQAVFFLKIYFPQQKEGEGIYIRQAQLRGIQPCQKETNLKSQVIPGFHFIDVMLNLSNVSWS